jgi:2-phosphosulfolactate phosphatase
VAGHPHSLSGALSQQGFAVRFDWGERGARALAAGSDALVVVDVLSFTTAVDVAVARGALVYPVVPDAEAEAALAQAVGAALAVHRSQTTARSPYSLSPPSMAGLTRGQRVVLPSPNGAAVSAAVDPSLMVVAGCLRNAAAVAAHLSAHARRIAVIAAGERWPDGALRPALEDAIGAGAILSRLGGGLSPEAEAAVSAYERLGLRGVAGCASASELALAGYAEDVRWAVEEDVSTAVPVLIDGAFRTI